MKIILARHGESEHNAKTSEDKNSPLTKKGKIQAEHLGRRLKKDKIKIDKIYTSHLIRSKQTAEIISKIIKVKVHENFEEFNEYPSGNLRSKIKILLNSRIRKLKKLLNEIARDKEKNETILIVAHGVTNRIIIGHLLEIPLGKQLLRLTQDNTGLNVMVWNQNFKNWQLKSMNDINHLTGKFK